jgi:MerR family transcriptional regulator, mercuric resistance operon regulatory protein
MKRPPPLMIGALAASTGVNIETIRYYEREGMLPAPPRSEGGQRLYEDSHVQRLTFIRRGRELGFSLDDIRALLQLVDTSDTTCSLSAKEITDRHLADVRGKIASLKKLERALKQMTAACTPGVPLPCPIIEALSSQPS